MTETSASISRVLWSLTERPLNLEPSAAELTGAAVLVLGAPGAHRAAVAAAVRARGARVALGYPGLGSQSTPAAWLVEGQVPSGIVDLGLLPPYRPGEDRTTWRLPLLRTVGALRMCYDRWSTETDARAIFYLAVTYLGGTMGYPLGGTTPPMPQPLGGLWAGLAKTLHRELPNVNARVLDWDSAADPELADLPATIATELFRPGTVEIGYRDGVRRTLRGRQVPVGPDSGTVRRGARVLISGGGRGIGYHLACRLADQDDVRVVVTGRSPWSDTQAWTEMSDEQFAQRTREMFENRDGRDVKQIRAERDRVRTLRELGTNLARARQQSLDIEYRQCDVANRGQVRALLADLGDVRGIVHNAGVDSPARLPGKSDEQILRTISTKIDGLTNLLDGVKTVGIELDFLCIVGSLTGRLGGMVGQLDYASANEGLARLGLWAQQRLSCPVMTMAWPTWDNVGLISNFAASLRYMTPVSVEDGLRLWTSELRAGTSGEVSVVGALGRALDPGQVIGYEFPPDLPDHSATAARLFHLGEVVRYAPGSALDAWVDAADGTDTGVGDLDIDGCAAVSPTSLLERAIGGIDWALAPDQPPLALRSLDDLQIRWAELVEPGRYLRQLTLKRIGDRVQASVTMRRSIDAPVALAVRALLDPREATPPPELPAAPMSASVHAGAADSVTVDVHWSGRVVPLGRTEPDGSISGREQGMHDRWIAPYPPAASFPAAAMETLLRTQLSTDESDATRAAVTWVPRVEVRGPVPLSYRATRVGPVWQVCNADGVLVLVLTTAAGPETAPAATTRHRPQLERSSRAGASGAYGDLLVVEGGVRT